MDEKKCRGKCKKLLPFSSFYKHKQMADGHLNVCKECKKKYERDSKNYSIYEKTEKGVIRVIYKTQKSNSKRRGHIPPNYSKEELKEWLYPNGFKALFDAWVASGYEKRLKPSCDRIDDYKGYSLDRLKLVTWGVNKDKQTNDILLARSTSGERCKAVEQLSLEDAFIKDFISASEASRQTGVDIRHISNCCLGKRKTSNGFKWRFKKDLLKSKKDRNE